MKILIALDESPVADTILDAVMHRQWPKDTEFFVRVIESTTGCSSTLDYEGSPFSDHAIIPAQVKLHDLSMQHKKGLPQFHASHDVVVGGVTDQMLQTAQEIGADLIILGHQGRAAAG